MKCRGCFKTLETIYMTHLGRRYCVSCYGKKEWIAQQERQALRNISNKASFWRGKIKKLNEDLEQES